MRLAAGLHLEQQEMVIWHLYHQSPALFGESFPKLVDRLRSCWQEAVFGLWTLDSDPTVLHRTSHTQRTRCAIWVFPPSLLPYLVLLGERPVLQNCYRHQGNNRYDTNHSDDDGHRRVPGVLLFHLWERGRERQRDRKERRGRGFAGGREWKMGDTLERERKKGVCVRGVLCPDVRCVMSQHVCSYVWERESWWGSAGVVDCYYFVTKDVWTGAKLFIDSWVDVVVSAMARWEMSSVQQPRST